MTAGAAGDWAAWTGACVAAEDGGELVRDLNRLGRRRRLLLGHDRRREAPPGTAPR